MFPSVKGIVGRKVSSVRFPIQTAALLATTVILAAFSFAQQNIDALHPDTSHGNSVLVNLFQPVYPPLARQANISGDVLVAVTVHPDGTFEAAYQSGHPMLKQAALDSAKQSRFECRGCDYPALYLLKYTFKLIQGSDCCTALSKPATVTQEPNHGEGDSQTQIRIVAEEICLCDPAFQLSKKRSLKCLYLWRCS